MTFQAYLDAIKAKTGKTPEDFIALAEQKGYLKSGVKAGEIIAWLKQDFGLGRGHAMAIVDVLKGVNSPRLEVSERINRLFSSNRAGWRAPYDDLLAKIKQFGDDANVDATDSYLSLLKGNRKFGVIYVTGDRMDIGIKLKGEPAQGRFEEAGTWNNMVTHRVRIDDPRQIDAELLTWLRRAYDTA